VAALVGQLHEPWEVDLNGAVPAVFFDERLVFANKLQIEHPGPSANRPLVRSGSAKLLPSRILAE
jgi:hypothetical protein